MGYLNPHTHQLDAPARPRVVALCGSTRFKDDFERVNRALTLGGHIVVAPGVFGHADGIELSEASKTALDALHLRKIDLADEVIVVNPGGYIGDSTRNEIAYAERTGKPVGYLDGPTAVACLACPSDCRECSKDESDCECYTHQDDHPDSAQP